MKAIQEQDENKGVIGTPSSIMIPGIAIFLKECRKPVRFVGVDLDLNCVGQSQGEVRSSESPRFC